MYGTLIIPFDAAMAAAGHYVGFKAATPVLVLGVEVGSRVSADPAKNVGWSHRIYASGDAPATYAALGGGSKADISGDVEEAVPHAAWALTIASALTWVATTFDNTGFTGTGKKFPKTGLPEAVGPVFNPIPEGRVLVPTGEVFVLELDDAPTASSNFPGFLTVLPLPG